MSVTAKFQCISNATPEGWSTDLRVVRLQAVYDPEPGSPNHFWSLATPAGYVELTITNPGAFEQFHLGAHYLINFDEVREGSGA